LDTPSHTLLEAVMSLLSHDHHEVEYHFVDNFNGIKTKTNVLRGFPTVIFTAAIDYSKYQRWPEIQRRFIVTNPKMTPEKYKESIELMGAKNGLPDFVYDATVVSEEEKNQARELIKELKEKILYISERNGIDSRNVFIPFYETIEKSLATEQASDMTIAQRLYNYMTLLPVVHIEKRPRLVTRREGDPILKVCPFATFEDLQESIYLMEYSNGVRPYVLEWYNEVLLKMYNEMNNVTLDNDGSTGLTSRQLADTTFQTKRRRFSSKQILENYIEPLINSGYLDKVENKEDRRSYLFYPVLNIKQKKLFDMTKSNNLSQQNVISIVDSTMFPDRNYIISKIQGVLRYSSQIHKITKLENHEGKEITAEEVVDQYYKDPGNFFKISPPSDKEKTTTTAIAISNTSIESVKSQEIKNNEIDSVNDEYSLDAKNRDKSQQTLDINIKSVQNKQE
jgi:hypothetical protein